MNIPPDPHDPTNRDPLETGPAAPEPPRDATPTPPASVSAVPPPTDPEPMTAAPPSPVRGEQPEQTGPGGRAKTKVAALVRGAAARMNKARKALAGRSVAGGRVVAGHARTIREKRIAGRCVIVTELGGHPVAIGPYRDERAARQDAARVPGAAQIAQLKPGTAYFEASDGGPTDDQGPSHRPTTLSRRLRLPGTRTSGQQDP
jgi:hypothetical protein